MQGTYNDDDSWREIMKKAIRVTLFLFLSMAILTPPWCFAEETEKADQAAIYKVVEKLEYYYEKREPSKFIDLFSQRKFTNYIPFKLAVENDLDLYEDIKLKRFNERLYLSETTAIYQAVWEKQYRPTLSSPFQRQRGLVRILLEKFAGEWKIIDLQGYPIFGTSKVLYPDLTVTNVWIMGGGRRIVGVVKNIGKREAKNFYVGFYSGNTFLGKAFVSKLDRNNSKSISWVWTPDPNRKLSDIRVVADVTNKVSETREDNNVGKIRVKPGDTSYCVDLSIDGREGRGLYVPSSIRPGSTVRVGNNVTRAPKGGVKTLKSGDKIRLCVEFSNIGGINADNVPVKVYYVTEHPDKTVTIFQRVYPVVPSKGKIRFCFFWIVPELERKPSEKTRRYIRVVLDPSNSLPECSEANNAAEQEIAIVSNAGPYDGVLTVSSPAKMPNEPCFRAPGVLTMTVTVEDLDLVRQNSIQITIINDVGNDSETYTLSRVGPGVFRGTGFKACVWGGQNAPTPGDGVLAVSLNGDHVTVHYTDQQDSQGKTVVRSRTVRYVP